MKNLSEERRRSLRRRKYGGQRPWQNPSGNLSGHSVSSPKYGAIFVNRFIWASSTHNGSWGFLKKDKHLSSDEIGSWYYQLALPWPLPFEMVEEGEIYVTHNWCVKLLVKLQCSCILLWKGRWWFQLRKIKNYTGECTMRSTLLFLWTTKENVLIDPTATRTVNLSKKTTF